MRLTGARVRSLEIVKALEVRNLSVAYKDRCVIKDFSFAAEAGEAVLLKGRSGCGKSTFLHAVCGLIPGSIQADMSGEILIFGRNVLELSVAERAKEIGIVFQNPETQLFCGNVEDEIAFGLENLCVPRVEIGRRIDEMLALTGLELLRSAPPGELSGGQKQLVVLASVLALDPKILLLDEALSQLDVDGREALKKQLHVLRQESRTLLMVDHNGELESVSSRVVDLDMEWL
jgi:energy-coupling factor transport system ATP-binding protein